MIYRGLSSVEAGARLKTVGYNELPTSRPKNIWRIALEVIREPMFLLLIGCATLYMILGDYREGIILLCSISIIIFITFYQSLKTERALEALRNLSSPRALVIRDGQEMKIAGREVVPDDVVILNEGDRVPADLKILDTQHLVIDESVLTGESIPVQKINYTAHASDQGMAFSGTLVVQGKALTQSIHTGAKTQFGQIGKSLQQIEQSETRLQKEMKSLIRNLFLLGGLISLAVILGFYFTRGNLVQSTLNGLASAMAILPEEFPVVLTIFLALGAWRLSKKKVLTRNPSAIETLGSCTILCSDKTGTITQNKMEIAAMHTREEWIPKKYFSGKKDAIHELLTTAFLASADHSIDPTEKAIHQAFLQFEIEEESGVKLAREYPLSKSLFAMTRVHRVPGKPLLEVSCKGAPEVVFSLCKMTEQDTRKYTADVRQMADKGYRILAVAKAAIHAHDLPDHQENFDFTFLGLLGFEDPIRPEVPQAIKECNGAGIKVIMITGDFPATARSIAHQIGMSPEGELLTGDQVRKMNDIELQQKISRVNIFARATPDHKLRIVQALKANHEIVAMTGDGVNDAPALKAANIGIAMGNKGTDVAREASSLVLLDDHFASIVSAIRSGRKIFDNLQKAMSYIMAIHIPIIGLTLLPAFIPSLPLLLMPLHIIFMELIIDPISSVAFEGEQEEKGIMSRPPRNPDTRFFGGKKILQSVGHGFLLLLMVMSVYWVTVNEGHTGGEVRAITFSALVIGNIFLILSKLSRTRNFLSVLLEKNIATKAILLTALLMLILLISVPALQSIFNFQFPGYQHFIPTLIGASSMLFILEILKFFRNKHRRSLS